MGTDRKSSTPNQLLVLYNQVDSVCPKCAMPLVEQKTKNHLKKFEVAHLYPLNPSPFEVAVLEGEERLSEDVNSIDNLIPLCKSCHGMFDKERTKEEYRELVQIKKDAILRDRERQMWHRYSVEQDLTIVIDKLSQLDDGETESIALDYVPKEVSDKTREKVSTIVRHRIIHNVRYYFPFLRKQFQHLETAMPDAATVIAIQVKMFALLTSRESEGEALFFRVARWLERRTGRSREVCEIVASYFVQNCEILE